MPNRQTTRTLTAANRTAARLHDQLVRARRQEGGSEWDHTLVSLLAHLSDLEGALMELTSGDPGSPEDWKEWPT